MAVPTPTASLVAAVREALTYRADGEQRDDALAALDAIAKRLESEDLTAAYLAGFEKGKDKGRDDGLREAEEIVRECASRVENWAGDPSKWDCHLVVEAANAIAARRKEGIIRALAPETESG